MEARDLSAGLDEVGMGCLAGPICAAAVVFPTNATPIPEVTDSKQLTFAKRMRLAPIIMKEAIFFGIGWAQPSVIDTHGVAEAWRRACLDALDGAPEVSLLKIDGNRSLSGYRGDQECYVKGDARFWHIGAASIIAKVARDLEMIGMHEHYPAYLWKSNMGYGSAAHLKALLELGPTWYHRGRYLRKIYLKNRADLTSSEWAQWEEQWLDFSEDEDELLE